MTHEQTTSGRWYFCPFSARISPNKAELYCPKDVPAQLWLSPDEMKSAAQMLLHRCCQNEHQHVFIQEASDALFAAFYKKNSSKTKTIIISWCSLKDCDEHVERINQNKQNESTRIENVRKADGHLVVVLDYTIEPFFDLKTLNSDERSAVISRALQKLKLLHKDGALHGGLTERWLNFQQNKDAMAIMGWGLTSVYGVWRSRMLGFEVHIDFDPRFATSSQLSSGQTTRTDERLNLVSVLAMLDVCRDNQVPGAYGHSPALLDVRSAKAIQVRTGLTGKEWSQKTAQPILPLVRREFRRAKLRSVAGSLLVLVGVVTWFSVAALGVVTSQSWNLESKDDSQSKTTKENNESSKQKSSKTNSDNKIIDFEKKPKKDNKNKPEEASLGGQVKKHPQDRVDDDRTLPDILVIKKNVKWSTYPNFIMKNSKLYSRNPENGNKMVQSPQEMTFPSDRNSQFKYEAAKTQDRKLGVWLKQKSSKIINDCMNKKSTTERKKCTEDIFNRLFKPRK